MLPSQRDLFDIPRDVCFLNAAAWSPLPLAVQEAGRIGVGAQGPAVEARRGFHVEAVRACAQGGGGADRRRSRRHRADPVRRLRRVDRRQGDEPAARQPRAGAAGRPHLAGARVDEPRRAGRLHGRAGEAAGRWRLDVGGAGGDRAQGRGAALAGLDLLGALVGRRRSRPVAHRRRASDRRARPSWSMRRTMPASAAST